MIGPSKGGAEAATKTSAVPEKRLDFFARQKFTDPLDLLRSKFLPQVLRIINEFLLRSAVKVDGIFSLFKIFQVAVCSLVPDKLPLREKIGNDCIQVLVETHLLNNLNQNIPFGNIFPIGKISAKYGIVKLIALSVFLSPFAQFLGQAAVKRHCPLTARQSIFFGDLFQLGDQLRNIYETAGEQILQGSPFGRRLRMERKGDPLQIDVIVFSQSFNTPGNEITPGSDVI